MNKWDKTIDVLTKSIYRTISVVLDRLSVFASAAVPAVLLGYSLAQALGAMGMGVYTAAVVGGLAAVGLEGYGLKALRVRFAQPDNKELKQKAYVYIGTAVTLLWADAAIIYAMDASLGGLVPAVIGSGFAFLSYNYYAINGIEQAARVAKKETAVALQVKTDDRVDETEHRRRLESERLAWERKQAAVADQLEHDEKMADIEARKQSRIANAKTKAMAVQKELVRERSSALNNDSGSFAKGTQSSKGTSLSQIENFRVLYDLDSAFTTASAVTALGMSKRGAGKVLSAAVNAGIIERVKRGVYVTNGVSPDSL